MLHAPSSASCKQSCGVSLRGALCQCPDNVPTEASAIQSHSSIQRQEVDVQKKDGIYEQGFLCLELVTNKQ